MNKKGRYGHFIGGILTIADFAVLNIIFLLMGLCDVGEGIEAFYTKRIWFVLNVSFFIAHTLIPDIHSKRVVYADKVVINALRLVALHAVLFMSILLFLDLGEITISTYLIFYVSLLLKDT